MQATREQVEHRQKLLDRLAQLEEAIPRLQRQVLGLSARIDQADIRAPEAGIVASLFYDTAAMVVARGDTVLTLSRPTERHQVSFIANPQVIDQLHVGMPGQLTVAALPQRSHPRVSATITSLSPEARRNSDGAVVGYDGVAEIDAEDHAALLAQLGDDATLTTDMPVSVVFAGRQTTFGAYLVGPFWGFLEKAMQD
nr:HlyD family efflux transporter periplasmic adaptor subunit [Shimia sp. R10_1]